MKKVLGIAALLVAVLSFGAKSASAQIVAPQRPAVQGLEKGMAYNEYKDYYNRHDYRKEEDDRYKPWLCGVSSLVIPGLGQMVAGETGRGLAFLGGNLACVVAERVAIGRVNYYFDQNKSGYISDSEFQKKGGGALGALYIAAMIQLGVDIWSICDACKVAKIKNMYYQDLGRQAYSLNLAPSFDFATGPDGYVPTAGLKLSMSF